MAHLTQLHRSARTFFSGRDPRRLLRKEIHTLAEWAVYVIRMVPCQQFSELIFLTLFDVRVVYRIYAEPFDSARRTVDISACNRLWTAVIQGQLMAGELLRQDDLTRQFEVSRIPPGRHFVS